VIKFSVDSHLSGFSIWQFKANLSAKIILQDCILHPNFSKINQTSLKKDETIVLLNSDEANLKSVSDWQSIENLINQYLNIKVHIKTSSVMWLKHKQVELAFNGHLDISKQCNQPAIFKGKLDAKQGYFQFKKKRFNLDRGQLYIEGLKPNNMFLSVTTSYRYSDYRVFLQLDGPLHAIRYGLYSEPDLNEAEIFSLLLFDKEPRDISKGEQVELRNEVVNYFGSFLTSSLTGGIDDFFSNSLFSFDFSNLDYISDGLSGSVGFGRRLGGGNNLFLYKSLDRDERDKILLDIGLSQHLRLKA